jgi:hypothetical protein
MRGPLTGRKKRYVVKQSVSVMERYVYFCTCLVQLAKS